MILFVNLPLYIQSFIGIYAVIIFWASASIIVSEIRYKHWKGFVYLLPISFCLYITTQCVFYIHAKLAIDGTTKLIVDTFGNLPWAVIVVILLAIGILELCLFRHNRKWIREHITAASV